MILWRVLAILTFVLFIASLILRHIIVRKNTKYTKGYDPDVLVKTSRENGTNNSYYSRHGADINVISRYVIRRSSFETSIILNYVKPLNHVVFYIAEFDSKRQLIDVLKVVEENTTTTSKIFVLDKRCKSVNVIVREADTILYNNEYIRPKKVSQVFAEQALSSLAIFSSLFVIRHIICEFMLKSDFSFYLESYIGLITFLIMLGVALIVFFSTSFARIHKIRKETLGGKVSYDFY